MILHIRCGSDIRDGLEAAGVPGDFQEWSDPICRGPVPPGLDRSQLRTLRADWIAETWSLDAKESLQKLEDQDAALDRLDEYERVILWFEHDLYDQACLIALLDSIGVRPNLFMITINDYPAVEPRFIGLGQLPPESLAGLYGTEVPIRASQVDQARSVFNAYRSGDAAALRHIAELTEAESPLPFLPKAIARHLQERPGVDGLTLTERLTLQALAEGEETAGRCFSRLVQESDPQPFLGDLMYWGDISPLFNAPTPAIAPIPIEWRDPFDLTDFGRAILAGTARWHDDNPRHGWWGGVPLSAATE